MECCVLVFIKLNEVKKIDSLLCKAALESTNILWIFREKKKKRFNFHISTSHWVLFQLLQVTTCPHGYVLCLYLGMFFACCFKKHNPRKWTETTGEGTDQRAGLTTVASYEDWKMGLVVLTIKKAIKFLEKFVKKSKFFSLFVEQVMNLILSEKTFSWTVSEKHTN